MSPAEWERRRDVLVRRISPTYRPAVHLATLTTMSFAILTGSLMLLEQPRAMNLLAIPATTIFSLGFEWWVHRFVLHRRVPFLAQLYERHEREHHLAFTADALALRNFQELRLVLIPAYSVIFIFIILLPLVIGTSILFSRNDALLGLATVMFLLPTYEWMHAAYHLPANHVIYRLPGLAWLREHHRNHHDPKLMHRWNFNVIVPIFDYLLGTRWSGKEPETAARLSTEKS